MCLLTCQLAAHHPLPTSLYLTAYHIPLTTAKARGQRHLLFGLPLLDPKHATPPYIEPASLPAFTRACQAIVRELIDDGTLKPGEQPSPNPNPTPTPTPTPDPNPDLNANPNPDPDPDPNSNLNPNPWP